MKMPLSFASTLILALALVACPTGPSISSFTATPSSLPAGGGSVKLEWTVSNADGLSIDQGVGAVSGTSTTVSVTTSKTFTLTATNAHGVATSSASVTVAAAPALSSLTLVPPATALDPGKTLSLTVVTKDAGGNVLPAPALTWVSSDTGVASVDASGTATGAAPGVTSITAKSGSVTSNAVNLIVRPSGGILSYSVFNSTTSTYQVHQTKLDGSQDIKIVDGWNPRFSPDGRFVSYLRDGSYPFGSGDNLYVFDLGAASEKKIYNNTDHIVGSSWTADGQDVVFDFICSIGRVHRDGSNGVQIHQANCWDDAPNINLTNGKIAFQSIKTGGLWVMNADGGSPAAIPNAVLGDAWPAWSPDGQWISFIRCDQSKGDSITKGLLYKIHPDGSGLTQLLSMAFDFDKNYVKPTVAWTPDGKFVVAAMVKAGTSSVQMVDAGGSGAIAPIPVANPDKVDFVGNTVVSTP
jgi:Tol biopolymer transport system component